MEKMTAVQFLKYEMNQMFLTGTLSPIKMKYIIDKALEMQKEQKIEFADEYSQAVMGGCLLTPTEFYNQYFKSE